MSVVVDQFSVTQVMDVDENTNMLGARIQTGYRLYSIYSNWGRDAAWTDGIDYLFRSVYGVRVSAPGVVQETIANHTQGFLSREAAGVEWQPKRFRIQEDLHGVIVPELNVRRIAEGAAVSLNFNWGVTYELVRLARNDYLELLKLWDVDTDQQVLPKTFQVK